MSEPLTIQINGQEITADMEEWRRVKVAIQDRQVADRNAWEQERRDTGQVWYALYMRYRQPHVKECFSRKDAEDVMEWDGQASYGIVNPDGSFDPESLYREDDLRYFQEALAEQRNRHPVSAGSPTGDEQ